MQLKTSAATLALVAAAAAQPVFTTQPAAVVAGTSATWAWTGAAGPVTIILRTGNAQALGVVGTLTTSASGGTFTWQVPAGTVNGNYALEIDDGTVPNYSSRFDVTGGVSGTIQTIATTGVATQQPTASVTGSATSSATLPPLTLSTTSSGFRNSTISTSSRTSTSSSAPAASTTVGNLNAAGIVSASPFAFLITAVLGLFVF